MGRRTTVVGESGRPLDVAERQWWTTLCVLLLITSSFVSLQQKTHLAPFFVVTAVLVAAALVAGGLFMTSGGRGRWTGLAVALTGALWPLDWWPLTDPAGPGALVAWLCGGTRWIALVYVGLTYPSDLHRGRSVSYLLWASVLLFGPGNLALVLLSRPEWNGFDAQALWPHLTDSRAVYSVAAVVYGVGCVTIAVSCVVVVIRRLATASAVDRLILRPSLYGMMVAGLVASTAKLAQSIVLNETAWRYHALGTGLGMLAVPGSLVWSSLKFWIARAGVVEKVTRLSRPATPEAVRQALSTALRDESVEVFLQSRERDVLLSSQGRHRTLEEVRATGRTLSPVRQADDSLLALITTDPRLDIYPQLLNAAVSAARFPLENARMTADLREALTQARRSRARIFEAQVAERRRLERDLHDGVQQRMLGLALRTEALRMETREPDTAERASAVKAGLLDTLDEIRRMSRGLHPAALQQGDLTVALAEVASGLGIRVRLDITVPRLPPAQESTIYFIVSEALANTVKYAGVRTAQVSAHIEGTTAVIVVRDDGSGGASMSNAGGLRGISDRVAALDGSVRVSSGQGRGTTIDVRLPLAGDQAAS